MAVFKEYAEYDATGLAALIRSGEVSRKEVIEAAITAIERINPLINAVVYEMFDQARDESLAIKPEAVFSGVPYLIKDLGPSYSGVPTKMGSRLFSENSTPDYDSYLTQQFRNAGLVPVGKSSTPEFALSVATESVLHGVTKNPWDLGRSAGGSSGGAAAAVAAGIVPIAHANDGAGSIRMPAAACGIVGYKPSRGSVSWAPEFGECWEGTAVNHVVTRSIRDSAAALDSIAGHAPGDPYVYVKPAKSFDNEIRQPPSKLRIGFTLEAPAGAGDVDEACKNAVRKAVEHCETLGHSVEEAAPKLGIDELLDPIMTLMVANTSFGIDHRLSLLGRDLRDDDVEKTIRLFWEKGRDLSASDYIAAVTKMHVVGRSVSDYFQNYDIFVSPVLSKPPVPTGVFSLDTMDYDGYLEMFRSYMPFTCMFNLSGGPGVSLPLYWTAGGLPIGVQFAAEIGNDSTLLRLAAQIEKAFPWQGKVPPVHYSHSVTG